MEAIFTADFGNKKKGTIVNVDSFHMQEMKLAGYPIEKYERSKPAPPIEIKTVKAGSQELKVATGKGKKK